MRCELARISTDWYGVVLLFIVTTVVMVSCGNGNGSAASRPAKAELLRFECIAPCMGMQARIVMFARDSEQAKVAGDAAIDEMLRLDRMLSDYRDDSETALVNRAAGVSAIVVSEPFIEILQAALEVSKRSAGAFDVTIGPVTRLWRNAKREHRTPISEELESAHALVSWHEVKVNTATREVRLLKTGMSLDFGGIGKGFAADRAMKVLREHGVSIALVALAGDIRLGDGPPGRGGWSIGLDDEISGQSPTLELVNCGISTSGDAEQFIIIEGERLSHIIDPREGLGLSERGAVSVIAPDAITADALATAASVMRRDKAMAMIESTNSVAARFVWVEAESPNVTTTSRFPSNAPLASN